MWNPNPIILDVECIVCNKSLQKIHHNPQKVCKKMGKIANRRARTPNWSMEEKQYLLELIRNRKDVVVSKTTNGPNFYEEKDVAWNEILRELSVKFGNKFHNITIKKVKTQWQNMKRIAREEITINGPLLEKYTRQSMEVCDLLELVKDGVLLVNPNNDSDVMKLMNDSTTPPNIEVKTERMDEDRMENIPLAQAFSVTRKTVEDKQVQEKPPSQPKASSSAPTVDINLNVSESSSFSEQISDSNEFEGFEDAPQNMPGLRHNFSANTASELREEPQINPFHRDLQQFFSYSNEEKQLKIHALKEERHVIRAMRETAELNKIIAEQRLKHVLWVKKQEMG